MHPKNKQLFGPFKTFAEKGNIIMGRRQYVARLIYGPGAGYVGGWTFYLALNCPDMRQPGGVRWMHQYRKMIQIGITRNANRVPYCQH